MAPRRKFYVVWQGLSPGIYDSWEEARAQVEGFAGARYKSFPDIESATAAFRGSYEDQATLLIAMARRSPAAAPSDPRIRSEAIAVDGACSSNPGPMEYRGVMVGSGQQVFHVGPLDGGTNNIGEYLALVHALALLDKQGDHTTPIYSDSRTALSWLRRRHSNTKLEPTARNAKVFELLERADRWVATHQILNPVLKWDTDSWGEIPADFGRK
ncbi:MAG: ribonuclease H family protein [Muribaculaceae bacterium]|nr:ribonuclease H family protein [Muribaculaceae bacterium]MDE5912296.1 ribonuclease H family protein [Muribaculaceae bacterium]MDE5972696.1 ribonuclease H family protein [Muribaculaceae bacterium]MDE6461376.1 ribonuclease H family protein [Muribaculaceae bacterium]MDE6509273.1 ribonuclease H family protein [Muribaculaceae bacterium]